MKFDRTKVSQAAFIKIVIIGVLFCLITPLYADTPWLHVEGNKIKDPQGNIVVLRGVALIDLGCIEIWRDGVTTLIDRLIDPNDSQGSYTGWGTKVVRLAVYPSDEGAGDYPWYFDDDPNLYYNYLLRPVVDYCKSKDLYVIIDWHYVGINTYDKGPSTTAFWTYIAQKFAGDSHVLFELFNEPANRTGANDAAKWETCRADMQAWTNIIRSYAPNNLILVGCPQWSQIIAPTATNPIIADNIVYVSHIYPDHWDDGEGTYVNQIRTAVAVHPVMITEWGFILGGAVPTSGTLSGYGQPFHEFREELGISHTAWCADYSWGPPMFNTDWTLRCGENYMGCFTKDILYETKDANQPVNGDTTPPAAPTGLSATAVDSESVTLDWNDNTEGDMYFYNVYRSTTQGAGYSLVNLLFVRDSNYIDTTVVSDTNYYYVVTAVDMSFNESDASAELPVTTPPDTTPPSAPTGLTATTDDSMVSLDWNNNTEHDLSGYNVYRSITFGSGYVKINPSLLTSSDYIDNSVFNNITYYYVVTAVDTSSNESDDSDEISATPAIPTEVEILGSWTTGTTHAQEAGVNRALVFVVHAEGSPAGTTPSVTSVTYGGQTMTKVVEIVNPSGITRTYTAAFILDEAGINAATTTTFSPSWGTSPSYSEFAHVFLQNVNQAALTGATASNATLTGATITTAPLVNGNEDMIIEAGSESGTGTYTANSGFTKDIDLNVTGLDGIDGHKLATGLPETPSVTHSATNGRQTLVGFVVQAAPAEWLYGDITGDNKVDVNDLYGFSTVWLVQDCNNTELDLNDDCIINFYEFAFFAQNWLEQ
ncbi:MAG: cellulase family glycosylhydrolase [Phycisphaerae bacterium]|jgi:fibronectin type 3 domain-containing protein